jgi:hypothetical protein
MIMEHHRSVARWAAGLGLVVALGAGCAAPPARAPLSDPTHARLLDQSRLPDELGITLGYDRDKGPVLEKTYALPLGARISLPMSRAAGASAVAAIPLLVNDKSCVGAVDLSASYSMMDVQRAGSLGVTPLRRPASRQQPEASLFIRETPTAMGRLSHVTAIAGSVKMGNTPIYRVPFGLVDRREGLRNPWWPGGFQPDVLLGHDLCARFESVTLNYPAQTIVFSSGRYRPHPRWLVAAVPLRYRGGLPLTQAHIQDRGPYPVALATCGDFGLWIPREMAGPMSLPAATDPAGGGRRGSIERPVADLTVNLSGFVLKNVPTRIGLLAPDGEDPPFAMIGLRVLSDYSVTFDFEARKIYFERDGR